MVERICAIHQPNLFPRWVTLAKLLAANTWVVLDDVQFCRNDYQHRARLGNPSAPKRQWLIVPVHLPSGRSTPIRDVRIADPTIARKRVLSLTRHHYSSAPGWTLIKSVIDGVAEALITTESLATIAETSTTLLLRACGWDGAIVRSSALARKGPISTQRSARLADLTRAADCNTYLSGRSGLSYLHPHPFARTGTVVRHFELPAAEQGPLLDLTALATLAMKPSAFISL